MARQKGFATSIVQISETETPLYKLQTVYRRCIEALETQEWTKGAFSSLIDRWLYSLEEDAIAEGASPESPETFGKAVDGLLERRLADVSKTQPQFAAVLRACYAARLREDHATEQNLISWLMGQPNVAASVKAQAGIKGDLDSDGASGFLRGLLEILRQTGRKGLVLVLDEVETIQRVRGDNSEKSLNALRQLIDDLHGGRYPGLYVLITGTPQFFDGPHGVKRLPPLAQRLATDFSGDPKFYNARATQIWLQPFNVERMIEIGEQIRDLYPSDVPDHIAARVDHVVIERLARGIAGKLGDKIGIAPRQFLIRLVDLLDRVRDYPDFDPNVNYQVLLDQSRLTPEEAAAAGISRGVDDIAIDVGGSTSGEDAGDS